MKLVELAYFTDQVEQMAEFYHHLLGTEPVARSEDMAIFISGVTKIFIHRRYTAAHGDLPPDNHIAFSVADVDATCRQLVQQGMQLQVAPQDYYWGRSAYLQDPDGHLVEITTAT